MNKPSRKICIITGTRAEYGHLAVLMRRINDDPSLTLQIIATGMHMSPFFGSTYREIEKDGFVIDRKIDMELGCDSPEAICRSMGIAVTEFGKVYGELRPEIIVVLGDRFEIMAAVTAAMIVGIPVAHISGGETTEGAFDEAIRHSLTKMSHIHFTSTEQYRQRVIQLGESPARVFNTGELTIELIKNTELMGKEEFEESIGVKLKKRNLLITYHPETISKSGSAGDFATVLDFLDLLDDTLLIFTKPNADKGGRELIKMIDDFVEKNEQKTISFVTMGYKRYLSALQFVDAVVGNSSSGITEAPSFNIGTINIGDRQKGRIMADSVISCQPESKSLEEAFKTLYSEGFSKTLVETVSPFGDGNASNIILDVLKNIDLDDILKKRFFDLDFKYKK